ncbi:hypothetical protein GQ54DRAFT_150474 [Martensiomyces pterosporus]|nr:hypothetical protein GQ54DRAFT_150474 [Martensiomyces pterosporus]
MQPPPPLPENLLASTSPTMSRASLAPFLKSPSPSWRAGFGKSRQRATLGLSSAGARSAVCTAGTGNTCAIATASPRSSPPSRKSPMALQTRAMAAQATAVCARAAVGRRRSGAHVSPTLPATQAASRLCATTLPIAATPWRRQRAGGIAWQP